MNATLEDLKMEQKLRSRNSGELFFTTKEGYHIPIKHLTDQQLAEAIRELSAQKVMSNMD